MVHHLRRRGLAVLLAVTALPASTALNGCASYVVRREPLTTQQVIQLAQEGRSADEIIQRIRDTHTVYILNARDVKDLLEKGVPERVVDEMLLTRLRDVERYYRYYSPYYYHGPYIGLGYGFSFYH